MFYKFIKIVLKILITHNLNNTGICEWKFSGFGYENLHIFKIEILN